MTIRRSAAEQAAADSLASTLSDSNNAPANRPWHATVRRRLRKIFLPLRRAIGEKPAAARYITCSRGHKHYGSAGGAGLVVTAWGTPEGASSLAAGTYVLLTKRSIYVSHSGLWGNPGGARDSFNEPFANAALREVSEETGLDLGGLLQGLRGRVTVTDHGGWEYHVFEAQWIAPRPNGVPRLPELTPGDFETAEVAWVRFEDVLSLPLLPAFRRWWAENYGPERGQ